MSDDESIDSIHVLVPTPRGDFECALCWGCTCHRYMALTEPCGKYSRNQPPRYGKKDD